MWMTVDTCGHAIRCSLDELGVKLEVATSVLWFADWKSESGQTEPTTKSPLPKTNIAPENWMVSILSFCSMAKKCRCECAEMFQGWVTNHQNTNQTSKAYSATFVKKNGPFRWHLPSESFFYFFEAQRYHRWMDDFSKSFWDPKLLAQLGAVKVDMFSTLRKKASPKTFDWEPWKNGLWEIIMTFRVSVVKLWQRNLHSPVGFPKMIQIRNSALWFQSLKSLDQHFYARVHRASKSSSWTRGQLCQGWCQYWIYMYLNLLLPYCI